MAFHVTSDQPWLPGLERSSEPTDRLFFAIFPNDAAARRTAQLARNLKSKYRLQGEPLHPKRFHVSLHHLGDYFRPPPQDIVARAIEAASAIAPPPFEIAFDRVMSFSGRHVDTEKQGRYPLVLLAKNNVAELTRLWLTLAEAMMKAGLRWHGRTHFTPHMTLLYDEHMGIEEAVDTICWTVCELVLVHSLLGQTRYVLLGRWPLSGRLPVQSAKSPATPESRHRLTIQPK